MKINFLITAILILFSLSSCSKQEVYVNEPSVDKTTRNYFEKEYESEILEPADLFLYSEVINGLNWKSKNFISPHIILNEQEFSKLFHGSSGIDFRRYSLIVCGFQYGYGYAEFKSLFTKFDRNNYSLDLMNTYRDMATCVITPMYVVVKIHKVNFNATVELRIDGRKVFELPALF